MSKVIKGVGAALGFGGESAASQATDAQVRGAENSIAFQKESRDLARADLAPYAQFGQQQLPGLQGLMSTQGQQDFLSSNPMFQAALRNANQGSNAMAAAGGRSNSGGLVNELFNNYLAQGDSYINSQFNRLMGGATLGQNSAAGQGSMAMQTGSNVGNALAGIGDARSAGILAGQNARAGLGGNLLGGLGGAAMGSGMLGGAGLAGGGMMGGGLGALIGLSDRKYKKNIRKISEDKHGNLYEFEYIWGGKYTGRMADELRNIRPDAVVEVDGALMVSNEFMPKKVA